MSTMIVLLTLFLVLFSYILTRYCRMLLYWKNKGIKYVTPLPVVGNLLPIVLQTKSLSEYVTEIYNKYPDERYCGTFQYNQPILLVKDPELIKRIFIKEFDIFSDHHNLSNNEDDSLWGKNLFASSGEQWKDLRQTISPFFTTSKMKSMFLLMEDCAKQVIDYLKEQNQDIVEVELGDIFKRYSADVIASIAFGTKSNSLKDRDNEFFHMGTELTNFGGLRKLKRLLYSVHPVVTKILNLKMHPDNVANFFRELVKSTIDCREKNNILRPDYIQHLLEIRKCNSGHDKLLETVETEFALMKESDLNSKQLPLVLSDDDITAQALDFFYGGFYSTTALMVYCAYELAINPEIQEKLRKEIDECLEENRGKINSTALNRMKYFDMVISETLRKWPTTTWIDRKSHKPFTIEPSTKSEKPLYLESGSICWIPVFAIQRDQKYWPDPVKFDPGRFSEQNRKKIHTSTFLPFGIGPRNCVGYRFAVMEAKVMIFYILSHYDIVPVQRSVTERKVLLQANDFWFGFKKRLS